MNPRLRKIIGDLKESHARSFAVVFAVVIGTLALSVALGARAILTREVAASFDGTHPASIVFTLDTAPPELVAAARQQPGVADADSRRLVRSRVEVAPGDWRPLLLYGVRDFSDLRVSTFAKESGAWPPADGQVLVERSSLPVVRSGGNDGQTLHVRVPSGTIADIPAVGVVHDAGQAPGWQDNVVYAYATPATLARLGVGEHLDELRLTVDGNRAEAARVAARLSEWLRGQGRRVDRVEVPLREHPHAEHMGTMLMLVTAFGTLALMLSGTLSSNVMAGLLARQVRQIGILKAVGATTRQITAMYFILAAALAAVGVHIGLPAGVFVARAFARFAATQLNITLADESVPGATLLTITLFCLGVPLVAALLPVLGATRRTAREALQDAGISSPMVGRPHRGSGLLARLLDDRRLTLALRNPFRRPARLWLTLTALAVGGAALMTAANVYQSLLRAVDMSLSTRGDDIDVRLLRPAPAKELAARVAQLPGVRRAEAWGLALPTLAFNEEAGNGGREEKVGTDRYSLLAPPADTKLLRRVPPVAGRWPRDDEAGAVLVNRNLQAKEYGLTVGREVALLFQGRRVPVRVVGVIEEVSPAAFYTNEATMEQVVGRAGMAGALRVATEPGKAEHVATELEEALMASGSFPTFLMTKDALRRSMTDHFLILLTLLNTAAVCAILVGGLGLATTTGLNVLERAREIGVMRAVGATRGAVLRLLLTEGAVVTGLSVLAAVALSLPLSWLVGLVVGRHGLHVTLPFAVAPFAIALWVVAAAVLTGTACFWPARAALRPPVREILAHE